MRDVKFYIEKVNIESLQENPLKELLDLHSQTFNNFLRGKSKEEIREYKAIFDFLLNEDKNIYKETKFGSNRINEVFSRLNTMAKDEDTLEILGKIKILMDLYYCSDEDKNDINCKENEENGQKIQELEALITELNKKLSASEKEKEQLKEKLEISGNSSGKVEEMILSDVIEITRTPFMYECMDKSGVIFKGFEEVEGCTFVKVAKSGPPGSGIEGESFLMSIVDFIPLNQFFRMELFGIKFEIGLKDGCFYDEADKAKYKYTSDIDKSKYNCSCTVKDSFGFGEFIIFFDFEKEENCKLINSFSNKNKITIDQLPKIEMLG